MDHIEGNAVAVAAGANEDKKDNTESESSTSFSNQPSPYEKANWFSKLFFTWLEPLLWLGARQPLAEKDFWPLPACHEAENLSNQFQEIWARNEHLSLPPPCAAPAAEGGREVTPVDDHSKTPVNTGFRLERSLLSFKKRFLVLSGVLFFFMTALQLVTPYLVQALISFVSREPDYAFLGITSGYVFAALLVAAKLLTALFISTAFALLMRGGMDIRNTLIDNIYQKALCLSSAAKQGSNTGEIITLMSVDTERLFNTSLQLHMLWSTPITLILGIALLINYIGVAALVGLGFVLITTVIQAYLATLIGKYRLLIVEQTEKRVKLINEALRGIRIIKFYAWEESITKRVEEVRAKEIHYNVVFGYCITTFIMLIILTPTILLGSTLTAYSLMGHELTLPIVFTTMAFVAILQMPLNALPIMVSEVVQAHISAKRIEKWLQADESIPARRNPLLENCTNGLIELNDVQVVWPRITFAMNEGKGKKDKERKEGGSRKDEDKAQGVSEQAADGHYVNLNDDSEVKANDDQALIAIEGEAKEKPSFGLSNINLRVEPGSLCGIVGPVGSGKSSLIHALIGEMEQKAGYITVQGKLSYVAQEAWIPHGSVRDTILFHRDYDSKLYRQVVDAAQLRKDIASLPAGDKTEIGEKGINLSGGQKARVALARALYRRDESDIYLLDDPLSAVDAHVARKIFDQAIMDILGEKTRVLVLNSHYELLKEMDQVIIMKKGEVIAVGHPSTLASEYPEYFSVSEELSDGEEQNEEEGRHEDMEVRAKSISGLLSSSRAGFHTKGLNDDEAGKLLSEEDREIGAVTTATYVNYFRAAGTWGLMALGVLFVLFILSQATMTFSDWWLAAWAQDRFNFDNKYWYIYTFIIVGVGSALFLGVRSALFIKTLLSISFHIHRQVFQAVLGSPLTTFFDVTPLGRIMNRFTKDIDMVDAALPEFLSNLLANIFLIIAALIMSAMSQKYIILALLPAFFAFFYIQNYFRKSNREMKRLDSITRSPIFSLFGETLSGISSIKAFGMQDKFVKMTQAKIDDNVRFTFCYLLSSRWLALRLDLLSIFIVAVVSVFVVIFRDNVDPSLAGLAINYSLMLTGALQWTVRVFVSFENAMTSVERLLHFTTLPGEESRQQPATVASREATASRDGGSKELVDVYESGDGLSPQAESSETVTPPESWPSAGGIEIRNVYMRYRPELELVLKGISLKVKPQEKIGIVGRTGAGKSSVMLAIYRIVEPESGAILIDGVDISKISLQKLRSSLAIIPQDPVMFSGTIRYNLDPFSEHSDSDLWLALERAHLKSTVSEMSSKLESEVSEGGENWSVGQRQLICIARALLRKSRILIMDEATASVDSNTDVMLQQTIRENFADRTVLCIAHRLDTVIDSDRIAVIGDGKVIECDEPRKLLQNEASEFTALAKHLGDETYRRLQEAASVSSAAKIIES